jgi:TDG/mug DNA glycosylase family protein
VPERLRPEDDHRLLEFNIGITDIVKRWSKSNSSLRAADYESGIPRLLENIRMVKPRVLAFNGKTAYERVSGKTAHLGLQKETIEAARVYVLPSTSGRNGSLTRAQKLQYFRRLARWVRRQKE